MGDLEGADIVEWKCKSCGWSGEKARYNLKSGNFKCPECSSTIEPPQ